MVIFALIFGYFSQAPAVSQFPSTALPALNTISLLLFSACVTPMVDRTTSNLVLMMVKLVAMKKAKTFECIV